MKCRTFIFILAVTLGTGFLIESISGQALVTGGNAQQTREKGGFVKAMIFIQGTNGTIVRCFNSYLAGESATTPPCGFTVLVGGSSIDETYGFEINFGFRINDRFVNTFSPSAPVVGATYGLRNDPNVLGIVTGQLTDLTVFVY